MPYSHLLKASMATLPEKGDMRARAKHHVSRVSIVFLGWPLSVVFVLFWLLLVLERLCFLMPIQLQDRQVYLGGELLPCALQGSDGHLNVCGLETEEALFGPWQMPCKKPGCNPIQQKPTAKKPNHHQTNKPNKTKMHPGDEMKK